MDARGGGGGRAEGAPSHADKYLGISYLMAAPAVFL